MHEKNPLRHLKRKGSRAQRAAELATAAAVSEQQLHEEYLAREKERQDRLPAGPGLKEYEVDADQFFGFEARRSMLYSGTPNLEHSMYKALQMAKAALPPIKEPDFKNLQGDRLYAFAIMSGNFVDRDLNEWLHANTPQHGYFTPEMVTEAVKHRDDIVVDSVQTNDLAIWNFSHLGTNESFEMSRTLDGSKPTVPVNPYLAAHYWNEYDFENDQVVATPRLSDATNSIGWSGVENWQVFKGPFGEAIMQALELEPVRIDQKVDFTLIAPHTETYGQIRYGELEQNPVHVPSSVIAHLPGAEL